MAQTVIHGMPIIAATPTDGETKAKRGIVARLIQTYIGHSKSSIGAHPKLTAHSGTSLMSCAKPAPFSLPRRSVADAADAELRVVLCTVNTIAGAVTTHAFVAGDLSRAYLTRLVGRAAAPSTAVVLWPLPSEMPPHEPFADPTATLEEAGAAATAAAAALHSLCWTDFIVYESMQSVCFASTWGVAPSE